MENQNKIDTNRLNRNRQRLSELQRGMSGHKDYDLLDIWDFLMASYQCWIPFEEFYNLAPELVNGLVERINKRAKEAQRANKR